MTQRMKTSVALGKLVSDGKVGVGVGDCSERRINGRWKMVGSEFNKVQR